MSKKWTFEIGVTLKKSVHLLKSLDFDNRSFLDRFFSKPRLQWRFSMKFRGQVSKKLSQLTFFRFESRCPRQIFLMTPKFSQLTFWTKHPWQETPMCHFFHIFQLIFLECSDLEISFTGWTIVIPWECDWSTFGKTHYKKL